MLYDVCMLASVMYEVHEESSNKSQRLFHAISNGRRNDFIERRATGSARYISTSSGMLASICLWCMKCMIKYSRCVLIKPPVNIFTVNKAPKFGLTLVRHQ